MSETSTLIGYQGRTIPRETLALVPTPLPTETHRPIPHHEVVKALIETLGFRHIGVVQDEYAVSPDGMKMFGVLECLHIGLQGTGSDSAVQGYCQVGRLSGDPIQTELLEREPARSRSCACESGLRLDSSEVSCLVPFHEKHCFHFPKSPRTGIVQFPAIGLCDRLPVDFIGHSSAQAICSRLACPSPVAVRPGPE